MGKLLRFNIHLLFLIFLMVVGMVTSLILHEIGHSVVCLYFGYDAPITITPTVSEVYCEAAGLESKYVSAAGGLAAVLLLPLSVKTVRRNDYVRYFLLAGGLAAAVYMPVESLFKEFYVGKILITSIGYVSFGDNVPNLMATIGIIMAFLLEIYKFKTITIHSKK